MVGIRNNAIAFCLGFQFVIAAPGITHQPQDLATISFHLIRVDARNNGKL
jgi:hypothetical protein